MKKFKFRLEAVLVERKKAEDGRLRDWAQTKRMLQQLVDDLSLLESKLQGAFVDCTSTAQATSGSALGTIGLLGSIENYINGTKTRIAWKRRDIERGSKLVEKARQLYLQAKQRRNVLEKLKENQFERYKLAAHKHELRQLDDVYIMNGAARKRMDLEDQMQEMTPQDLEHIND